MTDHSVAHQHAMGRAISNLAKGGDFDGGVDAYSWWCLTGIATADWNMVLVHADNDATLDDALERIAARGVPCLVMFVGAGNAQVGRLPAEYVAVGEMPVMSIKAPFSAARPDLRARITGIDDAEAVLMSLCLAHGLDADLTRPALLAAYAPHVDFDVWALEVDGEVVSTLWAFLDGDFISIWCMATPPAHQRKGYGRALVGTVLANAREAGATVGLLGASPDGYQLYSATGWETVESWTIYTNATSAQFLD